MIRVTDVIKQLIILNAILFVFFQLLFVQSAPMMSLFFPTSEYFRFWQPLTHMFMHAGFSHLFFNMVGLFFFGSFLEEQWGGAKFLKYYLICGVGSFLLQYAYWYYSYGGTEMLNQVRMLGASGAVMGCIAGAAVVAPNMTVQLLFPPIALKLKYLAIFYFISDLFMGFGNVGNVANFGHIGGLVVGFLITMYWKRNGTLYR